MRQTEVGLSPQFFGKNIIALPKQYRRFDHVTEVKGYPLANVARRLQSLDSRDRLFSASAAESAVLQFPCQVVKMTFKRQSHAESVFAHKHHIIVCAAKALFIRFYPDVRFHHGRAENKVKLITFKLVVKRAEGAAAAFVRCALFKCLAYGYRVYLFHYFLPILAKLF